MKVEILFFEGCPNHPPAVERVQEVIQQEGVAAEVAEVEVRDEATAKAVGFLGSPTIRVNGIDIEPEARSCKPTGMACRTYAGGLPSRELIREAIRQASGVAKEKFLCVVPRF